MAKRRINKQAVLILVGVLIAGIGGAVGLALTRILPQDPVPHIEKAEKLEAQDKYDQAYYHYRLALRMASRSKDLELQARIWHKLSDVLPHTTQENAVRKATSSLDQAITKDPSSVPIRAARIELAYSIVRDWQGDVRAIGTWKQLQEFATDLIDLQPENLTQLARAYYLRGVAGLTLSQLRRDEPQDALDARKVALEDFKAACQYDPGSAEYHKALAQIYVNIAGLTVGMRVPLPEEDRQAVFEYWEKANQVAETFIQTNPESGAAVILKIFPLGLPKALIGMDRDNDADQSQGDLSALAPAELIQQYMDAFRQNLPRPDFDATIAACDKLREEYLLDAEGRQTDHVAVQRTLAGYWLGSDRRDYTNAVQAMEKVAEHETDIIERLSTYLQIAGIYTADEQREKALQVCEQALEIPVDFKIIRELALRHQIYSLHYFAADTLLNMAESIPADEDGAPDRRRDYLDRAAAHLDQAIEIRDLQHPAYHTLRGRIALARRTLDPGDREPLRQAIQHFEQAKDQMAGRSLQEIAGDLTTYARLHILLSQAYAIDGQPGAAEYTLADAQTTIAQIRPDSPASLDPAILLRLVELQIQNGHPEEAQKTIDVIDAHLASDSTEISPENRRNVEVSLYQFKTLLLQQKGDSSNALAEAQAAWLGTVVLWDTNTDSPIQRDRQDKMDLLQNLPQTIEVRIDNPKALTWGINRHLQILRSMPDSRAQQELLLHTWASLQPDNPLPVLNLIQLYLQNDERDAALQLLSDAIANNPKLEPHLSRVRPQIEEEDFDKRQELLAQNIREQFDDEVQLQLALAQLYQMSRNYHARLLAQHIRQDESDLAKQAQEDIQLADARILNALNEAYRINPDFPAVREPLFLDYLQKQQWDQAQRMVDRAAEKDWDGVKGLYYRARLQNSQAEAIRKEDPDAAQELFNKALSDLEDTVQIRRTFFEAWTEKARTEIFLRRYDDALESAERAYQQNPRNIIAIRILMETTADEWRRALNAQDPILAERFAKKTYILAQRALSLQPGYPRGRLLALAYLDQYEPEKAIRERTKLLELTPRDSDNLISVVRIYQRQNRTEELKQFLVKAMEKQPDDKRFPMLLAQVYTGDKQYDKALPLLLDARTRWPESIEISTLLAEAYRLKDQPQQALDTVHQLMDTVPEDQRWRVLDALGLLETRLGRQQNAVAAYQLALNLVKKEQKPDSSLIILLARRLFAVGARDQAIRTALELAQKDDLLAIEALVDFYRLTNQPTQAVQWARNGVAIDPDSPQIKLTLAQILILDQQLDEPQAILEKLIAVPELKGTPLGATAYIVLAEVHSLRRDYSRSVDILKQAIKEGNHQPEVYMKLAEYYRFLGRFSEETDQYKLLLARRPGDMQVRSALVGSLIRQERHDQADSVLMAGRRLQPEEYRWPQMISALWLVRSGDPDEKLDQALKYAMEAKEISGDAPVILVEVMSVLNHRNEFDRSIKFYEEEIPQKYKQEYRVLALLGQAHAGKWAHGRVSNPPLTNKELAQLHRTAVQLFRAVRETCGDDFDFWFSATQGLVQLLGLEDVIADTREDITRTRSAGAQVFLATLINIRGVREMSAEDTSPANADFSEAISLLRPVCAQTNLSPPIRLQAYNQLATAYSALGLHDQAVDTYQNILRLRPDDYRALNNLAYVLADSLERPAEALEYIERAVNMKPQDANLLDTYGWTLYKAGQADRAVQELRRSVQIHAGAINTHHLALALKAADEPVLSLERAKEALELLQNDPQAEKEIGPDLRQLIKELEESIQNR